MAYWTMYRGREVKCDTLTDLDALVANEQRDTKRPVPQHDPHEVAALPETSKLLTALEAVARAGAEGAIARDLATLVEIEDPRGLGGLFGGATRMEGWTFNAADIIRRTRDSHNRKRWLPGPKFKEALEFLRKRAA